jgi:zinc protease
MKYKELFRWIVIFGVLSISLNCNALASGYFIKIYTDSLSNGLKVYYITDNSTPVISTLMYYKIGSLDETPDKNGMAHIMEHMMFGETEEIPRDKISSFIEEAGGVFGANTSYEESMYYIKLPSNNLKLALWIESQRIRKIKITTGELERQKKIIYEELKTRDLNQPYSQYYSLLPKIIYDAWPIIGNIEHIKNITANELEDFYKKHYQTNNAALVISGDINLANARKWVRDYFGSYESSPVSTRNVYSLPRITENYRKTIEDKKITNPAIFVNYRGPGIIDSNYYCINLLSYILANSENSRLRKRLAGKEKVTVEASISLEFLETMGSISIKVIVPDDIDISKVEAGIQEEINSIISKGITQEELVSAINYIESKLVFDKLDYFKLSEKVARYGILLNNHELINSEMEQYKKVTPEKIKEAAKLFLSTNRKATIIFEK